MKAKALMYSRGCQGVAYGLDGSIGLSFSRARASLRDWISSSERLVVSMEGEVLSPEVSCAAVLVGLEVEASGFGSTSEFDLASGGPDEVTDEGFPDSVESRFCSEGKRVVSREILS